MPTITPCLWFDTEGEEAARHYVSLFEDAAVLGVEHYGEAGPREAGSVMLVRFSLRGQEFVALNGGPDFQFSEATSFQVDCADQAEVDHFWNGLSAGGEEGACGWLKDRFGVSWQIIPRRLPELLGGEDRAGAERAMAAMMSMGKLDIDVMERAYAGTS